MKISFDNTQIAFQAKTNSQLQKSYWLFKLVGSNTLVKISPLLLKIAFGLRLPIKGLIKHTIFEQFCGGESIDDCNSSIQSLAQFNVSTILDYSVEGKSSEADFTKVSDEVIKTIERAKEDNHIPFAVFKVSGLARLKILEKVSSNIELSQDEKQEYQKAAAGAWLDSQI